MSDSRTLQRLLTAALLLASTLVVAQGFQLQRHEPTAAGEPFFAVRSPRYDAAHALAVGLTLNYGHHPLVGGRVDASGQFVRERVVISDQLLGHLDVAGVLFGRLQLSTSLPVTLLERGQGGFGVSPVAGMVVGDPRVGARVRLLGEDRGAFGLHLGGDLWIPVGVEDVHAGDRSVRGALGLIADGRAAPNVIWALNTGVTLRPRASLTTTTSGPGTVGPELQVGAAAAWISSDEVWRVGPELIASTGLTEDVLTTASTRFEALLGGGWRIGGVVDVGPAVGVGIVRAAGTPDFRALLRVAVLPFGQASSRDEDAGARDDDMSREDAPARREEAPAQDSEPAKDEAAHEDGAPAEPTDAAPDESTETAPDDAAPAESTDAAPAESAEAAPDDAAPADSTEAAPAPAPQDRVIATLNFESDSDRLTPDAEAEVERVLTFLRAEPQARVRLDGHGDSRGPERWNQTLSEMRAASLRRELVRRGVRADQIDVAGHGSSQPVADNASSQGRALNRRVEVTPAR